MSQQIHPLKIRAHPQLEKSLGYQSNQRWVAWYWEPDIEQAFFTDGQRVGTTPTLSWQIFLQHPSINSSLQSYFPTSDQQYGLLLDRKTRNLYVGEGKFIQNLLEQPDSLSLLACLETQSHSSPHWSDTISYQWKQFTRSPLLLNLLKWIPLGVGIAVVATVGFKTASSLIPQVEQKLSLSPPSQPILPSNSSCGVGGSDDLTRYVATTSQPKELHLIGVYEANSNHSGNHHPDSTISVKIERQNKPIILALSAYEPITWNLDVKPGVMIEKIIVNGYYDQKIMGVSNVLIEEYSHEGTNKVLGNFPYQWNQIPSSLVEQLQKQIGIPLTSFQGCYRGTSFQIQ